VLRKKAHTQLAQSMLAELPATEAMAGSVSASVFFENLASKAISSGSFEEYLQVCAGVSADNPVEGQLVSETASSALSGDLLTFECPAGAQECNRACATNSLAAACDIISAQITSIRNCDTVSTLEAQLATAEADKTKLASTIETLEQNSYYQQLEISRLQALNESLVARSANVCELEKVLDDTVCPITQEHFVDPVVAADGHTYERASIDSWLAPGMLIQTFSTTIQPPSNLRATKDGPPSTITGMRIQGGPGGAARSPSPRDCIGFRPASD
jgi:hypothetical protein